jgi:uncharacterized protein (TIGR03083 family)
MTADQERLAGYVDTWRSSVDDFVALLRLLDDADWERPTDLPGWDVRAVAAHIAHLESELAGFAQTPVEVPELEHIRSAMSRYTERGPLARASWEPAAIVDEIERAVQAREEELRQSPPTDGAGAPPRTPGDAGWDWETLLRNRPLDVWMHEQDVRRAVGRPGGMTSAGAVHTAMVLTMSLGYSVGKRVAPPAGTTVLLDVTGVHPIHLAVEVGDDGRASVMSTEPVQPTVALRMDLESFTVLGGGRRPPSGLPVQIEGDRELGERVLSALAITP